MGRSYNLWIKKMSIREPFFTLKLCESRHSLEGVNGVNRLATKGKKYHRLPTKREKKLPTTDRKIVDRLPTWTDIIHIFFRKKSILYFSYLSRN